jgi:hypothetical protein
MNNKKKSVEKIEPRDSNFPAECSCGNEAKFFHSKCCNAHFEGVIKDDGSFNIVCEECGKFCGEIERKSNKKVVEDEPLILFDEDNLLVWKDDDTYFFDTPKATLHFTKEEWIEFKKDLSKFTDL